MSHISSATLLSYLVTAWSNESQDGFGLSIVVLVVPSIVFSAVGDGMPAMEAVSFRSLRVVSPFLLVFFYLFNYICNFQSFSDVRISLVI
jgi:hypothetical protein